MIDAVVTRFGFARMPFGRDLPPSRLHRHADCGEAAARITWAVAEKTIAMVTGEVGAGKTIAIRSAVADLDHDQLESIRMMTNHDMDSSAPFATILVGQPTLRHSVKLGVPAALEHRITVRYQMKGMTPTRPPATSGTTSSRPAAPPSCSPTRRSPRSTRPPAASPAPSTTSPLPP